MGFLGVLLKNVKKNANLLIQLTSYVKLHLNMMIISYLKKIYTYTLLKKSFIIQHLSFRRNQNSLFREV